jgi:hypothetical protein
MTFFSPPKIERFLGDTEHMVEKLCGHYRPAGFLGGGSAALA